MMTRFALRLLGSLLIFGQFAINAMAVDVVPVITTKTDTYKNVTLISHTETHAFLKHSRGVATLKLSELDHKTLVGLGLAEPDSEVQASNELSKVPVVAQFAGAIEGNKSFQSLKDRIPANFQMPAFDQATRTAMLGGLLLIHLLFSYCLMLICKKAGTEPGILVWLPIFQVFPTLRAAGMSGWWFLALLVPVLNVVTSIMWCVKISRARGKGIFTAIMLMLPVTGFFAFLYLALSGGSAEDSDGAPRRPVFEALPA